MAKRGKERGQGGLTSIGDLLRQAPEHLRPPSPTQMRLIEAAAAIAAESGEESISYQHTVFCQTALPYRSVEARIWERTNGQVSLRVEAGSAMHPEQQKWIDLPLPFGPKARLIMIHLDTQAILTQSPTVELDDSMTAFVKKLQGRSPTGPELRKFKDQAAAVAGALFRFAAIRGDRTFQVDAKVVRGFELWYPKDERQRTLWPSFVELSPDYFATLIKHAVPMDHRAVAALALITPWRSTFTNGWRSVFAGYTPRLRRSSRGPSCNSNSDRGTLAFANSARCFC